MENKRLVVGLLRVLSVVLGVAFLYYVRAVLPPFILAGFIAYVLEPPVRFLKSLGFTRANAVFLIYVVSLLAVGVIVLGILPGIAAEFARFLDAAPEIIASYRALIDSLAERYNSSGLPVSLRALVDEGIMNLQSSLLTFARSAVDSIVALAKDALGLVIAPVVAFYILRDFDQLRARALSALPGGSGGRWAALAHRVDAALNGFIRGQTLLAFIVGTLVTLFTGFIGLRFSALLGLLAAIGEFVPYFGPLFAAVPAALAGFSRSTALGLEVVLGFVIIQQIENAILAPRILGESVGLHPVMIIFVLLAGARVAGFWGLFFSVPVFVVLRLVASFVYLEYVKPE